MGRCPLWLLALCQWFTILASSGSTLVLSSLSTACLVVCTWRASSAHSYWIGHHASCDAPVPHYCLAPPLDILVPVGIWRAYIGICAMATSCPHSVGDVRRRPSQVYIRLATAAQHQLEGTGDHLFVTLVNYKVSLDCFLSVMAEHWFTESIVCTFEIHACIPNFWMPFPFLCWFVWIPCVPICINDCSYVCYM